MSRNFVKHGVSAVGIRNETTGEIYPIQHVARVGMPHDRTLQSVMDSAGRISFKFYGAEEHRVEIEAADFPPELIQDALGMRRSVIAASGTAAATATTSLGSAGSVPDVPALIAAATPVNPARTGAYIANLINRVLTFDYFPANNPRGAVSDLSWASVFSSGAPAIEAGDTGTGRWAFLIVNSHAAGTLGAAPGSEVVPFFTIVVASDVDSQSGLTEVTTIQRCLPEAVPRELTRNEQSVETMVFHATDQSLMTIASVPSVGA